MSASLEPWMFAEICQRLMEGETLRAICRSTMPDGNKKFPPRSTVYQHILKDKVMHDQYVRARDIGVDAMVERLFEVADDDRHDTITDADGNAFENKEWVNRSKLKADVLKWYTSKLAPKRYGDQLTLKGDKEAPLNVTIVKDVPRNK